MRCTKTVGVVALVATALLLVSCAVTGADRAGGVPAPVTLRFANTYSNLTYLPQVSAFVDAVPEVSGEDLMIEIHHEWGHFRPGYEAELLHDLAAGETDMAWVGTRAFDLVGVSSFQALTAPMLIDSYALQAAVLGSDLPAAMLSAMDLDGVRGLAVLGGGLRKPFSVDRPWLSAADFRGKSFQTFESRRQIEAVEALGATARTDAPAGLDAGLSEGTIDGFEKQLSTVAVNGTERLAPYVAANVNLWPETLALVINEDRFDSLSATQQGWLQEAATRASQGSLTALSDDSSTLTRLCADGLRAGRATPAQLTELRKSFDPLYAGLGTDPVTRRALGEIERLKRGIPDHGAAELPVPEGCTGRAPVRPSPTPSTSGTARGTGAAAQAIEGVYRWELTAADAEAAGVQEDDRYPWPHLMTMTLADGRWSHRVRDARQDADYGGGPYAVRGDVLDLTWDDDGSTMSFHFVADAEGNLTLTAEPGARVDDHFVMTTHPWQRIG
ncbi:MAG TPA: TRAP transporter substrate-binding protein DctP [Microlunatus sp.]